MKITPARIGAALVVTVGVVAVSASTLIASLSESSALAVGSMAGSVQLAGDATLASDLKRMTSSDRSQLLSQYGLVSEEALAARMADARERINGFSNRQAHVRTVANYSSGFLYAALVVLALISLKIAVILGGKKPLRSDAAPA
jgi:hypothetical protein